MIVDIDFILFLKDKICSYESKIFQFKLFGGFIRDFLFPATEKLPLLRTKLKDIDIWVESKINYKEIENFMNYFIGDTDYSWDYRRAYERCNYEYEVHRYHIFNRFGNNHLFTFDFVYSKEFPVNDLSVNLLSYGKNGYEAHGKYDIETILNQLRTHVTDVLPAYLKGVKDYFKSQPDSWDCPRYHRMKDILTRFKTTENLELYRDQYTMITGFRKIN